jgi:hypothetical protein
MQRGQAGLFAYTRQSLDFYRIAQGIFRARPEKVCIQQMSAVVSIRGAEQGREDVAAILRGIHRRGSLVFHGEEMHLLGAVPGGNDLDLSPIGNHLNGTCYFSINSTGKLYPDRKRATGFFSSRKREHLAYLNAFYVDLDRHDEWPDCDLELLLRRGLQMVDFLALPSPTWAVNSGRGIWFIWVFSDPIPATEENRAHWQVAADSLADSFKELRPDRASSVSINRIMRVPDSRNMAAAGHRVRFSRIGPEIDYYRFARLLGVAPRPTPITPAEGKQKNPIKVKAARARWLKTYRGLEALIKMRGTFGRGQRSWIVYFLAQAMFRAGMEYGQVESRCMHLGTDQCIPALEMDEIKRKLDSGKARPMRAKGNKPCYASLSALHRILGVTKEETERIPELLPKRRGPTKRQRAIAALFRD